MMKILCIALLLALTFQLQLAHEQNNPFKRDRTFKVIANIDNDKAINRAKFNFTDKVTFDDNCGQETTFYEIRANNAIKFVPNRWVHVNATQCRSNKNWRIRELLKLTKTFNYGTPNVDLIGADSKVLMTLQKI